MKKACFSGAGAASILSTFHEYLSTSGDAEKRSNRLFPRACHELKASVLNKLLSKRLLKASQCSPARVRWQPFVVTGKSSEAGQPSEGAFHHPTARQEHEAALGLGQFDHFQFDAVSFGVRRRGGCWPRVALSPPRRVPRGFGSLLAPARTRRATCARSCSLAGVTTSASR